MWETIILFALIYVSMMYMITKYVYQLFRRKRWFAQNYLGLRIVHSFGLLIGIHYACFVLLLSGYIIILGPSNGLIETNILFVDALIFFISLVVITLMGWVDDVFGSTDVKGIRGHLRAFFIEHKLTSGFLKAVVGSLVAMASMYFFSETMFQWLLNTSLVVLSIHVFNLLDVRPGRAIKSYWFLSLLLFPYYASDVLVLYFLPALISTLLIFPYERKCLTMLGDAGSNVLGFIFGYYIVLLNDLFVQVFILSSFVLLSVLAEKISFSEYIQKTPWLAKVDNWGINKYFLKD